MKKLLFAVLYYLRVSQFAAWWHRHKVIILCYHSITMLDEYPDEPHKQYLPRRRFETHLDHLRQRYNVISLPDYLTARREGRALPPYSVVLTFDDGMRNFLTVVAPMLAARSFPATNFIVTDFVSDSDNSARPDHWTEADDCHYLSWPEIQALARSQNINFGSHTCSHPKLSDITLEEAKREMQQSYQALVEQLQSKQLALAFPHNQTSASLKSLAQSLGYACALTADLGPNDIESNLFSLRRTVISDNDDLPVFAARVAGVTWWADNVRELFRRRKQSVPIVEHQSYPYFQAERIDQE